MAAPDTSGFDRARAIPSSDGLSIATYDLGGDGRDLLLVHATGFCAGVWGPLVEHLRGFRVTAIDVRGHGRSDAPDLGPDGPGMSWAGTGDDVLAAIDALDLQDPVGAGHSMGGASLLIAELARPGTFGALWGFEPIVMPPSIATVDRPNPLADGARRRRAEFPSAEAAFANFAAKAPFDVLDPDALAAYVRYGFEEHSDGTLSLRCRPEVEAATYEMGPRHPTFERLGAVPIPVTVLRGQDTPYSPAAFAPAVADALPHGVLEEHPELGHFGPLQDPAAMAASISAALG
ncbi:MAG TPA: alpha/beta hydrolase [Microthrixaceae bacterium]|nr:alpha/beta hydrolase [Microthrixaceae bacterium]